jgi:hypothetical protein
METVIVIATILVPFITLVGAGVGIGFALNHGTNLYVRGYHTLSNVILAVSVVGIFATVALVIAEIVFFIS